MSDRQPWFAAMLQSFHLIPFGQGLLPQALTVLYAGPQSSSGTSIAKYTASGRLFSSLRLLSFRSPEPSAQYKNLYATVGTVLGIAQLGFLFSVDRKSMIS
jgi:hypothetical protein